MGPLTAPDPSLAPRAAAEASGLDPARLPRHVAIIMDGNGRWAQARGLPRLAGHQAGVEPVRQAVRLCSELGIPALTLFAFSTENWRRPAEEVSGLMGLLAWALRGEVLELDKSNVRLRTIGRTEDLPGPVLKELGAAQTALRRNSGLTLTLALNYGGRQEILDAVNRAVRSRRHGTEEPLAEADIEQHLYTAGLPELDLVIRTSGELRLSNFLLWQAAYAEIVVTSAPWPEFGRERLLEALREYQGRNRRFGGL